MVGFIMTQQNKMTILVTGGAGFIGSNFIEYFLSQYSYINIINLDLLTYAADMKNLDSIINNPNHSFIQGDINDKNLLENLFDKYKFQAIIHFAAESHVDNSIAIPDIFITTNVNGTLNLLDVAYKFWFQSPFVPKKGFYNTLFHHISTDEVFGSLGDFGYFNESSPYAPNSPYSASKASSDFLVRSYSHTYGLNAVITNCSNNYGPKQHDEKLIPTIIRNALQNKEIPIYGDGKNIRDWLYVKDHARSIDCIFTATLQSIKTNNNNGGGGGYVSQNKSSESHIPYFNTFAIGANEEHTNYAIARKICAHLDIQMPKSYSYAEQIAFVKDRAGHDKRYAIDSTKLQTTLGWKPQESFNSGIAKTIYWYIQKYKTEYG